MPSEAHDDEEGKDGDPKMVRRRRRLLDREGVFLTDTDTVLVISSSFLPEWLGDVEVDRGRSPLRRRRVGVVAVTCAGHAAAAAATAEFAAAAAHTTASTAVTSSGTGRE